MKTTLKIKNFRVFDDKGVSFDINPITILTGSNSSGKSSAVKAVFLLNSFLSQIRKDVEKNNPIELNNYKLDFYHYPNNLLGRFDKVVNNKSKINQISFSYSVFSLLLSKDVDVALVFNTYENDKLNNAYLNSVSMSTDEGVFYYSGKDEISYCNLNILREDYVTFLLTEFAAHAYCGNESSYEFEGNITKEEYKANVNTIKDYLNSINESRRNDILRYVRISNNNHPIVDKNEYCNYLEDANNNGYIFSIPLLDKLSKISKSDVAEFINLLCKENKSAGLHSATDRILNAFERSEFETFDSYFHYFENRHLEKVHCKGGVFFQPIKEVMCLHPESLSLDCNYLMFNPYDTQFETVNWDESNNISSSDKEKIERRNKEIEEWEQREITFDILYEIVMRWNNIYEASENSMDIKANQHIRNYIYEEPSMLTPQYNIYHIAYLLLSKFATAVVTEALLPDWGGNMTYVSSARAIVKRNYTLDENDDFSTLLQNYFEKKRLFLENKNLLIHDKDYVPDSFMNKWIGDQKFGISKNITFDIDKEGFGVQIRLHHSLDDEGNLLADEGYGITQLVSILLQIETAILSAQGEKVNRFFGLSDLDGYDTDNFHYEINTIAIEEPEIHLHPKFQSMLADMFVEAYEKYNIHFVIETHSEYLIRKLQLLVSGHVENVKTDRNEVSIFYVNSKEDKTGQIVKRIGICKDGYLDDSFGEGFYDEATRLSRMLM